MLIFIKLKKSVDLIINVVIISVINDKSSG